MITAENAKWVIFGVLGVPLLLLIVFELALGRFWWNFRTVRKEDAPFSYWMHVVLHSALFAFLAWYFLCKF